MHQAVLITESHDAENIAKSLNVDNVNEKNLEITTKVHDCKIETKVKAKSVATLLSTLDDVIRCQIIAEKTIKNGNC